MIIRYSKLQFELTRRCNQECAHCCRGESQNVDLTEEIVDAFFANNEIERIDCLLFSGGEPTLNGQLLLYIVDKIIQNDIVVEKFMLSINGLSYSEELIQGLDKLKKYILSKIVSRYPYVGFLMISQDQYHQDAKEEILDKLQNLSYFSPLLKITVSNKDILPYGRALTNQLSDQEPDLSELTDYQKNYKFYTDYKEEYLCIEYQYISANGNILNDGCQSYDLMDEYALGNVLTEKIVDVYLQSETKRKVLQNNDLK